VKRQNFVATMVSAACLVAVAPAAAEELLLLDPMPVEDWQPFDGPYLGVSLGYGQGSPNVTATLVFGHNYFLMDNFYLGHELSATVYNDSKPIGPFGSHEHAYIFAGKVGTVIDRTSVYGMLGAGIDTNVKSFSWRATAGVEYLVTDSLGLNAEISSTQSFSSFGDVIQGQLGFRFHHDAYRGEPLPALAPEYYSHGIVQSLDTLGENLGIYEVRGGPAVSNLELNPNFWFEPILTSFAKSRLDTLHFDIIMQSPELFTWIGGARPTFGGALNFGGYESLLHAGLNWQFRLGESPFYTEVGLGMAVHNGYLDNAPAGFRNLGCPVLSHWQYGAGMDVNDKVTVTATWKHISGWVLGCNPNDGINTFGVSAGWKF
jgi:lipid A 3-O-deacylase